MHTVSVYHYAGIQVEFPELKCDRISDRIQYNLYYPVPQTSCHISFNLTQFRKFHFLL